MIHVEFGTNSKSFQSPLIGAFVPSFSCEKPCLVNWIVSIPSDRGIRSEAQHEEDYFVRGVFVSIPSDRGIRSETKSVADGDHQVPTSFNPL